MSQCLLDIMYIAKLLLNMQTALVGMSELKHSHKATLCPKVNPL